jgi:hypothetical protein
MSACSQRERDAPYVFCSTRIYFRHGFYTQSNFQVIEFTYLNCTRSLIPMSSYRVVLAVPAVVSFTVDLDADDQAGAMANALDAAARLAPGQSLPLVSSDPTGARIEACTRREPDAAPTPELSGAVRSQSFRVCFYADAARARQAPELELQLLNESAPSAPVEGVKALIVPTHAQALALATQVLDGSNPAHTARVTNANGLMVYQAVNPYGPIALVAYATLDEARARSDQWRLLEGWQADLKTARRRALAVLEQGFVCAVGIAVREPGVPGHGLRVRTVLEGAS